MHKLNKTTNDIKWTPVNKRLTPKQQAFIKHQIDNDHKVTPTASARAILPEGTSDAYARLAGHRLITNDNVLTELAKYRDTAQTTLVEVMNTSNKYSKTGTKEGASYASVAVQSANSILDRLLGKATTRVETASTSVNLNIDLTGVTDTDNNI
jgi:non-homologous end joining protein Ku